MRKKKSQWEYLAGLKKSRRPGRLGQVDFVAGQVKFKFSNSIGKGLSKIPSNKIIS